MAFLQSNILIWSVTHPSTGIRRSEVISTHVSGVRLGVSHKIDFNVSGTVHVLRSNFNTCFRCTRVQKLFQHVFQVYMWGSNTEGQLGLGPEAEENVYQPQPLDLQFKVWRNWHGIRKIKIQSLLRKLSTTSDSLRTYKKHLCMPVCGIKSTLRGLSSVPCLLT